MARPKVYDDAVRTRLVDAAARAVATAGATAVSLRRVSAAAGTTTNAVYTIFGSRQGLLDAVAARAKRACEDTLRRARRHANPVEDLIHLALAYRRWALANPSLYAVAFGERGHEPLPALGLASTPPDAVPSLIHPLADLVTELGQDAALRDVPVRTITWSIWAAMHGLITLELAWWHGQVSQEREHTYLLHCDAIVRGWLAGGNPEPLWDLEPLWALEPVRQVDAGAASGRAPPPLPSW